MADPSRRSLPRLASLLPRAFREQVVEPAYADFLLEQKRPGQSLGRRMASRCAFAAECLRLGLPAWLWWRGRPTRLSNGVIAGVVLFMLMIWIITLTGGYS